MSIYKAGKAGAIVAVVANASLPFIALTYAMFASSPALAYKNMSDCESSEGVDRCDKCVATVIDGAGPGSVTRQVVWYVRMGGCPIAVGGGSKPGSGQPVGPNIPAKPR